MTSLVFQTQVSVDDLRSSDSRVRLRAIKNLPLISHTIGKEKTRTDLLPFLTSLIEDEDEDNLIELTKIISNFIELIGGKQYILHILKFFENLLQLDEFLLRYEVVKGIKTLFNYTPAAELENSIIDIISKLLSSDYINNKLSIIVLIPIILPYASVTNKNNLTQLYMKLCVNDNVSVKREASLNFKDLAGIIDDELYIKILTVFIKDPNDNIRINIVDSLVVLKNQKNPGKFQDFIISCFNTLVHDESWRIRYTFADKIHEFLNFLSLNTSTKAALIEIVSKNLEDSEAEVRNACCQRLEHISEKLAKEESFDKILKKLKNFENEPSSFVKENFSKHVLRVCPYINKSKILEYIIPPFLCLISEENHNIRLGILKNVDKLNEVITLDIVNQYILPAFLAISTNKNWRIRIQVTDSLPIIAKIVNKEVFLSTLLNISFKWISDEVFAIREEGCKVLKKLYDYFRCEDFEKRLIDKLTELKGEVNYLRRNIVLILIQEFIIDVSYRDFVEKSLLPFVILMSKDKVCNIRMTCGLILKKILKNLKNSNILNDAKTVLEELKNDTDPEVTNSLIDLV